MKTTITKLTNEKYTITNNKTGRSHVITSPFPTTLDAVWLGEKYWFLPGCSVTITDENGNSKTFTK